MNSLLFLSLIKSSAPADTIQNIAKPLEKLAKQDMSKLSSFSFEDLFNRLVNGAVDLTIKILIAVVVFYIGKFLIKKLYKLVHAIMIKRDVDPSLTTFILSLIKITLLFVLIIIVIGILGIETSSFIAIFASAGVAIGMALSGTLQNFAGGVLILLIKPYKVGDFIEVQGYNGTVKEIQIFYTIINTPDNKSIILPNGSLSTGNINNFSKEAYRRVDWKISISYGDDIELAKKVALEILLSDKRIVKKYIDNHEKSINPANIKAEEQDENQNESDLKNSFWNRLFHPHRAIKKKTNDWVASKENELKAKLPKIDCSPFVALGELGDSSINIVIRAWTKTEDYWNVYFEINEKIYNDFPKAGLNFPFPQLDVFLKNK